MPPIQLIEKFVAAVSGNTFANSRTTFSKLVPYLNALALTEPSPSDQQEPKLLACCARYALWDQAALPLITLLVKRWDSHKISGTIGLGFMYINEAAGIISGLSGQHDECDKFLETALRRADTYGDHESSGRANLLRARFERKSDVALVHARQSASMFEWANRLDFVVEARLIEAKALLRLGKTIAAGAVLSNLFSVGISDKSQKGRFYELVAELAKNGERMEQFDVALSFPGEARRRVEIMADRLGKQFGRDRILYDRFHQSQFIGANADLRLQSLYRDSALSAVFLCKAYSNKPWCGVEWRVIRETLRNRADDVVFLRLDDEAVPGTTIGDGFIDLRVHTAVEAAEQIIDRWIKRKIALTEALHVRKQSGSSTTRTGQPSALPGEIARA